jgi:UDP-2,3-diacylglucosamine hydrolase
MHGLRPPGTLFISDLHLDPGDPAVVRQFHAFLETEARRADALYILGDLFEAWLGDDDPDPLARGVVAALRELTDAGVPCFVMHGNRDFLIGSASAARAAPRCSRTARSSTSTASGCC